MIRIGARAWLVTTCAVICFAALDCASAQTQGGSNPADSDFVARKIKSDKTNDKPAEAIQKAVEYLGRRQAVDGAWHAEQYGAMKQGAAVTALTLYAISHLTPAELKPLRDRGALKKASLFLQKGIQRVGCVANQEGSLDFPVYSTALILTAHQRIDLGLTQAQTKTLLDYLISSQCTEPRGFKPGNANYGGWDILGPGATEGKSAGANVSVTYYVLEALTAYEHEKSKPAIERAKKWCKKIANSTADGGFYFTSQLNSTLNKAGRLANAQQIPRPYGTATCDGLGIMVLTQSKQSSTEVSKTIGWLKSHPSYLDVPGFLKDDETGWPNGLRFYYLAALSRSVNQFAGEHSATQRSISANVIKLQLPNGSWQNESTLMREDEPLVATAFALIALANSRQAEKKKQK